MARAARRSLAEFLGRSGIEERQRLRAHGLALLLVALVAAAKHVTGLTLSSVPFTAYLFVGAISAAYGGFPSGIVATLAALLVAPIGLPVSIDASARALFVFEGLGIAGLVAASIARLRGVDDELAAARESIHDLEQRARQKQMMDAQSEQARDREWTAYREQAARDQAALQQAADDARDQLAAIEALTDPSVNPHAGPAAVQELLERLQSTLSADAVALVRTGRSGPRVLCAVGLTPCEGRLTADDRFQPSAGWVALVQNDSARIEQVSSVGWPTSVRSLMVVPVFGSGQVSSTIEVASERPRRATDWDVALVRIVADRLASVVVQDRQWPTDAVA